MSSFLLVAYSEMVEIPIKNRQKFRDCSKETGSSLSFAARKGTILGGQWGPPERLRRGVNDCDGSEIGDSCSVSRPGAREGTWGRKQEVKAIVVPADRSSPIGPVGPEDGPSAMGAIGTTSELQDHRAIDQAIEKRGG